MEAEEQSIHLCPTDPKGKFWQEGDTAGLDLAAILFRTPHVLTQLLVKFVQSPGKGGAFVPELGVDLANPLN
jgi:hypothetical protein